MAKAAAEEFDVEGTLVKLSSPDKAVFPELGEAGTKRMLFDYYRAVAASAPDGTPGPLVRALFHRPTYLQRFPDGIEGEEVYQKRIAKFAPSYIETADIMFPSGRTATVMQTANPATVVWGAQMGTVTFHPWHARAADPDHPDELRLDFDPQPGTSFTDARSLALEVVRPLFDELGLIGFPKTSGGRGLHVYIRIEPRWTFPQMRRAAIALGREIERRAPERVTTSWWKEERGERMFLDYNQNARDRTVASAYSARRTARATVSTPLTWAELADAEPDDFTIATVPARLAEVGDPMATIDDVAHSIEPLLEMAARDEANGLGDLPYPPNYPKMPGEPKRVAPSRARSDTVGNPVPYGQGIPDLE